MLHCSWDMVCDRCNCYFSLFQKNEKNSQRYPYFTQLYQKSWSYAILFLKYDTWQILLFFILGYFLSFYSPNKQPKKLKFQKKKNEKNPGDIIILHKCYIAPEMWCMTHVIVIFHFGLFCPFTHLTTQKIKIQKKWKALLEIS